MTSLFPTLATEHMNPNNKIYYIYIVLCHITSYIISIKTVKYLVYCGTTVIKKAKQSGGFEMLTGRSHTQKLSCTLKWN